MSIRDTKQALSEITRSTDPAAFRPVGEYDVQVDEEVVGSAMMILSQINEA